MKTKKCWSPCVSKDSEDLTKQISWNSSTSEEWEPENSNSKRLKRYFPNFQEEMKLAVKTPIKIIKINADKSNDNLSTSFKSDECVVNFREESPILSSKSTISDIPSTNSPIISENYSFRETSPVLVGREIIKTIKLKKEKMKEKNIEKPDGSSPEIFCTQESNIIEENDSPSRTKDTSTTCSQDLGNIELISSQDSSSLVILNPTKSATSVKSSSLSDECYHHPSPRRRNSKKNGLLHQLKKSLNLQKSRISLWHHDIFCGNLVLSDVQHIKGILSDKWKDFGCTILKCLNVDDLRKNSEDIFLISLGSSMSSTLILSINQIVKIYHPFKEKIVQFGNKETKLYFNVSKVLVEPPSDNAS